MPYGRRGRSTMPATAASTTISTVIPTNRAGLSLVPNVVIANSRAHAGLRSTVVDPTAKKGDDGGPIGTDTNWPIPSTTAAASIPDSARVVMCPPLSFRLRPSIRRRPGSGWVPTGICRR